MQADTRKDSLVPASASFLVKWGVGLFEMRQGENGGCAVLLQKMKDSETPGAIVGATTVMANNTAN